MRKRNRKRVIVSLFGNKRSPRHENVSTIGLIIKTKEGMYGSSDGETLNMVER